MKVSELMRKQVAFEEAIWAIRDIMASTPETAVERTSVLAVSLEENSRIMPAPSEWSGWADVSLPATVVSDDLEVVASLIRCHEQLRAEGKDTPEDAYEALRGVLLNATLSCPWAEQAFGQRFLCEQVEALKEPEKEPEADTHTLLASIYEATSPGHPTTAKLSRAVFLRLATAYPADRWPVMVLIAGNVLEAGFLEEDVLNNP